MGERAGKDATEGCRVWRGVPEYRKERILLSCANLREKGRGETERRCTDECCLMVADIRVVIITVICGHSQMYPRAKSRNEYLRDRVELLCIGIADVQAIRAFISNGEKVGSDNASPLCKARKDNAIFRLVLIGLVDYVSRPIVDCFNQTLNEAEETPEIVCAEKLCQASNGFAYPYLSGRMLNEYFECNRSESSPCKRSGTGFRS